MNSEPPVPDDAATTPSTSPRPPFGVNLFFRIAAGLVLVFVITIFALIAILFGDPAAPVAKWLDQHGMRLIVGEMCAILVTGALAMTIDRWQALRADSSTGRELPGE
ncbi:MAG: hypothetical protein JWN70_2383 [Planctomycetaceae bacterium]|nr:hypothetical protein [Planctomycetaceae bacterium]